MHSVTVAQICSYKSALGKIFAKSLFNNSLYEMRERIPFSYTVLTEVKTTAKQPGHLAGLIVL